MERSPYLVRAKNISHWVFRKIEGMGCCFAESLTYRVILAIHSTAVLRPEMC